MTCRFSLLRVPLRSCNVFVQNIRCLSLEATKNDPQNSHQSSPFYLFPAPMVVTSSFEIGRFLGNTISRVMYYRVERAYTDDKFVNGTKDAIALLAKAFVGHNHQLISNLSLTACATLLFDRLKDFPIDLVRQRFSFEKENIIHAYVHSSTVSPNKAFNLELNQMTYFATVVAVIDRNATKQVSLSSALDNVNEDTLFCNITLCRQLYAPGKWKISHVNFFNNRACHEIEN